MEQEVPTTEQAVVKQVGKIKGFFIGLKQKATNLYASISGAVSNDKAADGIMRWPRPVAFFLIVIMFVLGWYNPATLLGFAQALAAFPESFWNVIYIILGSIGVSKGANDIAKILSARK